MLNDYYYDERNKLLVMEHAGEFVGAEFQILLPEILEKVQGQVNNIIADVSKVTSATIIDTDLALADFTLRKISALGVEVGSTQICVIIPQDSPQNVIRRFELLSDKTSYKEFSRSVSWERAFVELDLEHFFSYPFSIKTQSE